MEYVSRHRQVWTLPVPCLALILRQTSKAAYPLPRLAASNLFVYPLAGSRSTQCRHSVDSLVVQAFPKLNQEKYVLARKVGEGFLVYGVSLGIALAIPGQSAKIIAVTGEVSTACAFSLGGSALSSFGLASRSLVRSAPPFYPTLPRVSDNLFSILNHTNNSV